MKNLVLKSFKIYKLFGIYDVNIPFKSDVNIFIGENGLGKTTILNCINYVLSGDIDNLYNIDFLKIEVVLGNDEKIIIEHKKLFKNVSIHNKYSYYNRIRYLNNELSIGQKQKEMLYNEIKESLHKRNLKYDKTDEYIKEKLYKNIRLKLRFNISFEEFCDMYTNVYNEINQNDWRSKMKKYLKHNLIFLPTYRRIEENFNKFIDNDAIRDFDRRTMSSLSNRFLKMQFGMDDIEKNIEELCTQLKTDTNTRFREMTSNILKDYIEISKGKKIKQAKIDSEKLYIVFSRLADEIDEKTKYEIINTVVNNNNSNKPDFFMSIIENLVKIYEYTQTIDNSLENFKTVSNRYLVNNQIVYDNLQIECYVEQLITKERIALENLSSGEKQIISLFSKLYLSNNINNIILFDEPELSLSIIWQAKLIPDIIKSGKCSFLIAVTHSPFIFDNEYLENAVDIKNFIKPSKLERCD